MQPIKIKAIMDLAKRARDKGFRWNPIFVGPPGVGKSEIVQEWCKENDYPFIDLRLAYLESVDLVGFPSVEMVTEDGNQYQVTKHNTPDFLPRKGKGVLLLEEPNRGNTSVMNACMQLLTDRKIHKYTLPEGWIIASCINPEEGSYDVNTMDAALRDRFEFFNVTYDKKSFIEYAKSAGWDETLIMFVESGAWQYSSPEDIGNIPGSKYVSPRTLSKLNGALKAGVHADDEMMVYESILGSNIGKAFYTFKYDDNPVTIHDLKKNKRASLKKLKGFSDPANYKAGYISITINSIVEDSTIDDDLLVDVIMTIPADQGQGLIHELEYKQKLQAGTILNRLVTNYPEVRDMLKSNLSRKGK